MQLLELVRLAASPLYRHLVLGPPRPPLSSLSLFFIYFLSSLSSLLQHCQTWIGSLSLFCFSRSLSFCTVRSCSVFCFRAKFAFAYQVTVLSTAFKGASFTFKPKQGGRCVALFFFRLSSVSVGIATPIWYIYFCRAMYTLRHTGITWWRGGVGDKALTDYPLID